MPGVTLADIYTVYSKPSLDGRLVIRKKTARQVSARLKARKDEVAKTKPAVGAHKACSGAGKTIKKRVYVPGKGYEVKDVCPIKEFKKFLSEAMPK
jgi:hypothetical protein